MNTIHVDLLGTRTHFNQTAKYTTRVIEAGDGPPLILMHGGGGHAEAYSRNMTRLGGQFRAMSIDFLWHGLSSKPAFDKGNWLTQFTDQVLDLMDSQDIEKAHLEGESLGAWIVLDMAINHPDRCDRVILNTAWGMKLDPAHVAEQEADLATLKEVSLNALADPSRETMRKRMEWLMPREQVTDEIVAVRADLWGRPDTNKALVDYYEHLFDPSTADYLFGEDDIRKISVPTLVLWTDRNPLHGVDAAERLATLIPGAQLYVMKDAVHWPQWEHPEDHDQTVIKFLNGGQLA